MQENIGVFFFKTFFKGITRNWKKIKHEYCFSDFEIFHQDLFSDLFAQHLKIIVDNGDNGSSSCSDDISDSGNGDDDIGENGSKDDDYGSNDDDSGKNGSNFDSNETPTNEDYNGKYSYNNNGNSISIQSNYS